MSVFHAILLKVAGWNMLRAASCAKNATNRPCKGLSEYIGPDFYDFEVSNDDPKCLYRPKTRNYSVLAAIWRITTPPYRRLNNTFDGGITIMEN